MLTGPGLEGMRLGPGPVQLREGFLNGFVFAESGWAQGARKGRNTGPARASTESGWTRDKFGKGVLSDWTGSSRNAVGTGITSVRKGFRMRLGLYRKRLGLAAAGRGSLPDRTGLRPKADGPGTSLGRECFQIGQGLDGMRLGPGPVELNEGFRMRPSLCRKRLGPRAVGRGGLPDRTGL